eukprot:11842259-Karenia_brevis.AAC.1
MQTPDLLATCVDIKNRLDRTMIRQSSLLENVHLLHRGSQHGVAQDDVNSGLSVLPFTCCPGLQPKLTAMQSLHINPPMCC